MDSFTDYTSQPAGSGGGAGGGAVVKGKGQQATKVEYWDLAKLRQSYSNYLFSKRDEINEQVEARRYYHGTQWTQEQITVMKRRNQPVMTFNQIGRKINGVIGLIEKLRQDPKAYPRTPQHEQGAELATAAIKYVLDEAEWKDVSPLCAGDGAVDGIGGIELELIQGDQGDHEVGFDVVDIQAFFYDPRSYQPDFEDARYMGVGKWLDEDVAREMFPDADEGAFNSDSEMTNSTDREARWFMSGSSGRRLVRIIDIWYKNKGQWCYSIFSGNNVLQEGESYLRDEKGESQCKYLMFSCTVDQDGDRYGFVRNMKSAQDGINAKQSKLQHILASRRLMISQGAVSDIEKVRAEWARPDGVVVTNRPVGEGIKADDQSFDFAGWVKLLEFNKADIENFGPNPALIGQGVENKSGRAIALLQEAGIAELGPYILAYRGWKVRVYRAVWNAIKTNWTAERWIRVTDNEGLAQFIQLNGLGIDPQTGQPTIINAVGQLDVDIILDEGPDYINSMQDTYEAFTNILPAIAPMLSPPQAQNMLGMLVDTSPLPSDVKKRFKEASQQAAQQPPPPDPAIEAAKAKAALDLQARAASADLEQHVAQQTAQQSAQAKQADIAMELQRYQQANEAKREEANIAIETKRTLAQLDIEATERKNDLAAHSQYRQYELDLAHGTDKANIALEQKGHEAKMKTEAAKGKFDKVHTALAETEAADHVSAQKTHKGIADLSAHTQETQKGLMSLAKSIEAMTKQMAAPTTIMRDANNRIVGARKQAA